MNATIFIALSALAIGAPVQEQGAVRVTVQEGAKYTYEIVREARSWGADDTGKRFLIPGRESDRTKMILEVTVQKPDRMYYNFANHVAEYSRGGRKALAEFGADGRDWPSWCNPAGVMVLDEMKLIALREERAQNAVRRILGIMGFPADGEFILKGQFIYSIPLGLNFRSEPWALGDEKFICYKWTKDGDFANIEVTRSKYEPMYGDEDYKKTRTYVTGKARLSLKEGLLVSSDVEIDNGTQNIHLVSRRL